jgi:hypothetical protein
LIASSRRLAETASLCVCTAIYTRVHQNIVMQY